MKKRMTIKILSGLINITTCLIVSLMTSELQDWLGDIYAFMFWTIPLATGLSVSGNTISALKTRNIILRILLVLAVSATVAFGWTYVVFRADEPSFYLFSFRVFYIWIIGIFFQLLCLDNFLERQEKKSRLLNALIIFPLTLSGSLGIVYSLVILESYLTRPEPTTYLIHENFEGTFRIIYGEDCGIEPKIENGRWILEIPDNGLLIVKPEFKKGVVDHDYFLLDSNGNKTRMSEMLNYHQRNTMIPGVLWVGSGGMPGEMSDGSFSSESPLTIHFSTFFVFNRDTIELADSKKFQMEVKMDSLTTAVVEECRRKNRKLKKTKPQLDYAYRGANRISHLF